MESHIKKVIQFNDAVPDLFGPYAYPYYWVVSEIESDRYSSRTYSSDREYYVFKYTHSGRALLSDGKNSYPIYPGSILLLKFPIGKYECIKDPDFPEPWIGSYFEFHAGALEPLIDKLIKDHGSIYSQSKDANIDKKMFEFEKLWTPSNKTWFHGNYIHLTPIEANSLILFLLSSLVPFEGQTNSINTKLINSVCSYINSHLDSELKISTLAKQFAISRGHLTRLFRSNLNTSPNKYIRTTRVRRACDLIMNTNLSNSEIAECIGANSIVQYHRLFKQSTGITPGTFKKSKMKLDIMKNLQ